MNEQIVIISNLSLTQEEFKIVENCLAKLDLFLVGHNGTALISRPKSTKKVVYSVDCGALVSERDAFILAIKFYVNDFLNKINIQ